MKIKLLNDGGYLGLENVEFPVEVECRRWHADFEVLGSELIRVGGDAGCWDTEYAYVWNYDEVMELA